MGGHNVQDFPNCWEGLSRSSLQNGAPQRTQTLDHGGVFGQLVIS